MQLAQAHVHVRDAPRYRLPRVLPKRAARRAKWVLFRRELQSSLVGSLPMCEGSRGPMVGPSRRPAPSGDPRPVGSHTNAMQLQNEQIINRPPEDVFDLLADLRFAR